MFLTLLLPALAAEPFALQGVDPFLGNVNSVAVATADGQYWFSLQSRDVDGGANHLWLLRRGADGALGPVNEVGAPLSDPWEFHQPAIAAASGSWVHLIHRVDDALGGPTNELVEIRPFGPYHERYVPAPVLDDGPFLGRRGHASISVHANPSVVFACWTRHTKPPFNDDILARMFTADHHLRRYSLAHDPSATEEHCSSAIQPDGSVVVVYADGDGDENNLTLRFITPDGTLSPTKVELGSADANFPSLVGAPDGSLRLVAHTTEPSRVEWTRCDASCDQAASWAPLEEVSVGVAESIRRHGAPIVDTAGHDFVAFEAMPPVETLPDARVYITARCADGWADGQLVDGSAQGESIGGTNLLRGYPFVSYDPTLDEVGIAYVRDTDLTEAGVHLDAMFAHAPAQELFDTLCPGG